MPASQSFASEPIGVRGPSDGGTPLPSSLSCRSSMLPGSTSCRRQPRARAIAEALQAIVDLDLDELSAIEPPRGFGLD
jgi:hypothetical protein